MRPFVPDAPFAEILHRFFLALDETEYQTMLAIFAPDARWHRQGAVLRGRTEIGAALQARPLQRIRHVITNTVTNVRGDEAETTSYMTAYRRLGAPASDAPPKIAGPFRVSVVHTRFACNDETWLIAEMRFETQFDLDEHAC
ncbi:MAG: hypothetical protein NVSMB5_18490 [Candidatus Velthaea sp.]